MEEKENFFWLRITPISFPLQSAVYSLVIIHFYRSIMSTLLTSNIFDSIAAAAAIGGNQNDLLRNLLQSTMQTLIGAVQQDDDFCYFLHRLR